MLGARLLSRAKLLDFAQRARELLNTQAAPLDVLWQHSLLGYIDGSSIRRGRDVFYSATREDRLNQPQSKVGYALHPIMIDTTTSCAGSGSRSTRTDEPVSAVSGPQRVAGAGPGFEL
jgi:hypothetical protein